MWSPTGKPVGRNPEQEPPAKAGAQGEGLIGRESKFGGYRRRLTRDIKKRLGINGIERKGVTPSVKRFVPEKHHR
jgi:hypothetical protein